MKDLTQVFEKADRAKAEEEAQLRAKAVFAASACGITSSRWEWVKTPGGFRLPLQPGLWLFYGQRLNSIGESRTGVFLQRVDPKIHRVETSGEYELWSATALANALRKWGYS